MNGQNEVRQDNIEENQMKIDRLTEDLTRPFLLEIGLEELPAQFAESAAEQLGAQASRILIEWGLVYRDLQTYVTPRRLALLLEGLPEQQPDLEEEVKGPSIRAAYDGQGIPTKALLGFMRGQGVEEKDVFQKELNGAAYVYARKFKKGRQTESLLPDLIGHVLGAMSFPKPMRWGSLTLRFARPVRWLVALFGDKVVPFQFAGLTSGRTTRGHRTMGGLVRLHSADEYREALKAGGVVADQKERRHLILAQIAELENSVSGQADRDEALLTEIVHLVEYPTVFCGKVDKGYMVLPDEVITTPMKQHQRYFPVRDTAGKLLPVFFGVRNGGKEALEVVVQGNQRVLKARLEDAAFYYREDAHRGLEDYLQDLDGMGYHERLGSVGQRVKRLRGLTAALAEKTPLTAEQKESLDRAVLLAKADLTTKMVYDFPELQGIMGGYYAQLQGDSEEVALAIREHYQPRAAGDALPQSAVGRVLSLADRLDALAGFFGAGIQPTGSQDPFALRRQAQGIAALLMDKETPVDSPLSELVELAFAELIEQGIFEAAKVRGDKIVQTVEDFCLQRVRHIWLEKGLAYDALDAVLARGVFPYGNICLGRKGLRSLTQQVHALSSCREQTDFVPFLNAYTRCVNLGRKEAQVNDVGMEPSAKAHLSHKAEQTLLADLERIGPVVRTCLEKDDYIGAFEAGLRLVPDIEALFDAVMIMDPDPFIRQARLALLGNCAAALGSLGDLTLLAG